MPRTNLSITHIQYLEEQGYVVIKNALSTAEASKTLELLWDYLEGLGTGIDRKDVSTWGDDRWPTCAHGGIMPSYGIGHSEAQWYLRGIPNVKKAFAKIWNTDELLQVLMESLCGDRGTSILIGKQRVDSRGFI